jgi:hypothetical protein
MKSYNFTKLEHNLHLFGYGMNKYKMEILDYIILDKYQVKKTTDIKLEPLTIEVIFSKKIARAGIKIENNLIDYIKALVLIEYFSNQYPYFYVKYFYSKKVYICKVQLIKNKFYKYLKFIFNLMSKEIDINNKIRNSKLYKNGSLLFPIKDLGTLYNLSKLQLDFFTWSISIINKIEVKINIFSKNLENQLDVDKKKISIAYFSFLNFYLDNKNLLK